MLAFLLAAPEFWHDSLHLYPATEGLEGGDIVLFLEWSQRGAATPDFVLTEELIDDGEVAPFLPPAAGPFSLLALKLFFEAQDVVLEPSFDLIYCRRPLP